MRVVLREDIDKLGRRGEVREVAAGYARNFLLPKGKALTATDGNMKRVEQERRRYAVIEAKEKEDAAAVGRRIAGVSCTIVRKVGENDQLYGSVTALDAFTNRQRSTCPAAIVISGSCLPLTRRVPPSRPL